MALVILHALVTRPDTHVYPNAEMAVDLAVKMAKLFEQKLMKEEIK